MTNVSEIANELCRRAADQFGCGCEYIIVFFIVFTIMVATDTETMRSSSLRRISADTLIDFVRALFSDTRRGIWIKASTAESTKTFGTRF